MIRGRKRYLLNPPRACPSLGIISDKAHPSFRHSELDWSDEAAWPEVSYGRVTTPDRFVRDTSGWNEVKLPRNPTASIGRVSSVEDGHATLPSLTRNSPSTLMVPVAPSPVHVHYLRGTCCCTLLFMPAESLFVFYPFEAACYIIPPPMVGGLTQRIPSRKHTFTSVLRNDIAALYATLIEDQCSSYDKHPSATYACRYFLCADFLLNLSTNIQRPMVLSSFLCSC